jgi:serine/threonine-protein kinase
LLLLLALLLAVGLGVGAWWFGWARWTQTPSVLGLNETAAVQKLEAAGLEVDTGDPAYSETVSAGKVLSTDPGPGERVLDGGAVTVVLSLGKERYEVPKVRGLSEDDAQDALADRNLEFGDAIGRFSDTVRAGTVLGSDPEAGTSLKPGTIVDLYVSEGPRPISLRDWTGRDAERAQAWFEQREIEVQQGEPEFSDTVPEGHVISQTPASGTLFRGETVTLVVSQGPELVEVPGGLIASGVDSATDELTALGFEVEVDEADEYIGLGFVFSVDPPSGTMVPRGSTITLYLI